MKEELQTILRETYPSFFRRMTEPDRTRLFIECDDGWFDLICKACEEIKNCNPSEGFCLAHIKEKFGGLRIYADEGNTKIYDILDIIEQESFGVCEACGTKDGVTSEGRWIRSLCSNCRSKKILPLDEDDLRPEYDLTNSN